MNNNERAKRFQMARTGLNQNGEETKTKVYELTGVPASAISAYENPESNRALNVGYTQRLAEHYGVNAAWLLGQSESWSLKVDVKQVCEMTGLTPDAFKALHDLMEDEERKRFINSFLASEEFSGMVRSLSGMRCCKKDSSKPVEYASIVDGYEGESDIGFCEGDYEDMRIWRASRALENVMRVLAKE